TQPATPPAPPSGYSQDNTNYSGSEPSYDQNTNSATQDPGSNNPAEQRTEDYSTSTQTQDGQGNTYITNNYYNEDDYYDYAYSARLRRYYNPVIGYNYYDPYYTNMYWYDYNPTSWGVSIYLGYNWWAPTYYYSAPFCYGSIGWGYNSWYGSPWYGGYYSPYSYWHGYNHGYSDGYWAGYNHGYNDGYYGYSNPYYYNSYDNNSYYGPRGTASGNSPRPSGRQNSAAPRTLGEKYQIAQQEGRIPSMPSKGVNTGDSKNTGRPSATPGFNEQEKNPAVIGRPEINNSKNQNEEVRPSVPARGNDSKNENTITPPSRGIISDKNLNGNPAGGVVRPAPSSKPNPDVIAPSNNQNPKNETTPSKRNDPVTPVRPDLNNPSQQNQMQQQPKRDNQTRPNPPQQQPKREDQSRPKNNSFNRESPGRGNENADPRNFNLNGNNDNNPANPRNEQQRNPEIQRSNQPSRHEVTVPKQERNNMTVPPPRQEPRTPMIQPRNEPKQFRQEAPAPQKNVTPSTPPARQNNSGEQRNGGGRRK
ncbi:MAG TPA: hypothetical protein PLU53_09025, partial [Bacteroidia bacterium]|nr:hypothetical protein [Bacteroidia bacterium]